MDLEIEAKNMRCVGFEHLHNHSHFSLLDGFQTPDEAAEHWHHHGQYLCFTDHGMMGAVPSQIKACDAINDKHGKGKLNAVIGCELYVNKAHFEATPTEESRKSFIERLDPQQLNDFKVRGSHLLAIAVTDEGYKNLVRLCSWGHLNGFYGKPRVNHEILKTHKAGLVFTSCCYASEIGRAFDTKGEESAEEVLKVYMEMFKGQFYLEIMMLDFVKQKPYDIFIIKMKEKYGLPIILTQDCHYCKKEDSHYQRLMLMVQTKRTLPEIEKAMQENEFQDFFELQDQNLWMKSEEELNSFWLEKYSDVIPLDIFEEAKMTTVKICKSSNVSIDRSIKFPEFPDAGERLKNLIIESCKKRNINFGSMGKQYLNRVREELDLITRKGFASYIIVQKMMADEARRVCPELLGWGTGREAIGPGRGSCGGSLILYLLGVTDVDPVKHGLLFSRFLSEARGGKQLKLRFPT
jgi:DNA polymerase-3 subunit alpha